MQARSLIQPALAALEMSPRERGQHLRLPMADMPEEEETTLGSALVSSLRSFLRQVPLSTHHAPMLAQWGAGVSHVAKTAGHDPIWALCLARSSPVAAAVVRSRGAHGTVAAATPDLLVQALKVGHIRQFAVNRIRVCRIMCLIAGLDDGTWVVCLDD